MAGKSEKRYVAFLRGVSPMNLKMPVLKGCLEKAGFSEVKTLLSSGNVAFNAPTQAQASLEEVVEAALRKATGKEFPAIVRSIEQLEALLERDPFQKMKLPAEAKKVVTFLKSTSAAKAGPPLPIEKDGAVIRAREGAEVFSTYVVNAKGPVFMSLLEKRFGKEITTRTWNTVAKAAKA